MSRRPAKPAPPLSRVTGGTPAPRGILELDRFSEATIERWNARSADLDELNDVLHFNLEPERRRQRDASTQALRQIPGERWNLDNWVRLVSYQYSMHPLSAAGSLTYIGGRFNAGIDLEHNGLQPWPALYIAQDFETAFREKFQRPHGELSDGLTPEELSLNEGGSHATVLLTGQLSRVFNMTAPETLNPIARILASIKMPDRAMQIKKRLKIQNNDLKMARTGRQLFETAVVHNWRILPIQFELPSNSQILAELIREAGFEAIAYPSSKGGGHCLAIFPDSLAPGSVVALRDTPPPDLQHPRLDISTAEALCGWNVVGRQPPITSKSTRFVPRSA